MQDDIAFDRMIAEAGGEMAARRKGLIASVCGYCGSLMHWQDELWRCSGCGLEYREYWWRPLNTPRLIEGKPWPTKAILETQADRKIGRVQIVNGIAYRYTHDVHWERLSSVPETEAKQ